MPPSVANPQSFHAEARWQGVCAWCGKGGPYHAHHVVDQQTLKGLGISGNALYDPRNALRLCARTCHFQFEWGGVAKIELPLTHLPDAAIAYAAEVFVDPGKAYNYLTRRYVGSDPRVDALLAAWEAAA